MLLEKIMLEIIIQRYLFPGTKNQRCFKLLELYFICYFILAVGKTKLIFFLNRNSSYIHDNDLITKGGAVKKIREPLC